MQDIEKFLDAYEKDRVTLQNLVEEFLHEEEFMRRWYVASVKVDKSSLLVRLWSSGNPVPRHREISINKAGFLGWYKSSHGGSEGEEDPC